MTKQGAKTATPSLRFPDFRVSEGWSTERMDRLYSFGRNNILSRDKLNYVEGTAKNIHYGDIHTKFPATFDVSREQVPFVNQSEALPEFASGDYCIEGDLVFADASEDMNDVGKTMEIVRLHGEQVLAGQHTILARQRGNTLVTGFGAYLFGSGLMRGRIKKEAQGTKVFQISASRLGGIDVTYPSDKAEQQKIAECLTSLDEVIAAQGRKVEALKAHKRGLMQQLFPREGETRPRLRFPEFRNAPEWMQQRIEAFARDGLTNGIFNDTKRQSSSYRLINVSEMYLPNPICESDLAFAHAGDEEIKKKLAHTGDIFFTRSSLVREGIAYSNIYLGAEKRVAFDGHLIRLRPKLNVVVPVFLHYALKSDVVRSQFIAKSKSATMTTISQRDVGETGLAIPQLEEQQRIADCLASLDTRITAETARLAALKTHKQGLMQQLFPAPEATGA